MNPANDNGNPMPPKLYYWLRDTFDQSVQLTFELTPARVWTPSNDDGYSNVYPKTTLGACKELQTRGLKASVPALNYLIRQKLIEPDRTGRNYGWSSDQIDSAAAYFDSRREWMPTTHFCRASNLEFAQVVRAYRVAAALFRLPWLTDFDVRNLVSVIEPPADPSGFSTVRFYPRGTRFEKQEPTEIQTEASQ